MRKLIEKFRDWRTKRFIKKLKNACINLDESGTLYINCNISAKGMITAMVIGEVTNKPIKKIKKKNG